MSELKALAPRPWRIAREWDNRHWTNSCSIFDADGGEVCVLTRGYQAGDDGDGCPSYDNAELIVAAVNAFVHGEDAMTTAYGNLIVRHHQAARSGDENLRVRIYDAIELFAELWPDKAKAWERLFPAAMKREGIVDGTGQ